MSYPNEVTMRSVAHTGCLAGRNGLMGAVTAAGLSLLLAVASGCNAGNAETVSSGHGGNNGSVPTAAECLRNAPGCPCSHQGMVIKCGVAADAGSGVKCAYGGQICNEGEWSECYTNSNDPSLQSAGDLKTVGGVHIQGLTNDTNDSGVLPDAMVCGSNLCDPYCVQFPDTPSGIDAGDAGLAVLGCGDAATLTIVTSGGLDASVAPTSVLADAGLTDAYAPPPIYMVLPPGAEKSANFSTPAVAIKSADIYFLIDDTSSMGAAATNLATALYLNSTTGIIPGIRTAISGTWFGVGRFEDYFQAPYVSTYSGLPQSSGCYGNNAGGPGGNACPNWYNLPYQNILSLQPDPLTAPCGTPPGGSPLLCTPAAVTWLTNDAFDTLSGGSLSLSAMSYPARSGGDIPEGSISALWATATGNGIYWGKGVASGTGGPYDPSISGGTPTTGLTWWVQPRDTSPNNYPGSPMGSWGISNNSWASPPAKDTPPTTSPYFLPACGTGTVSASYPCFRTGATPVIILMSDAPAHDGPAGQYPHVDEDYTGGSPSTNGTRNWTPDPHLIGANTWPIQPVQTTAYPLPASACPSGYTAAADGVCLNNSTGLPVSGGCPLGSTATATGVAGAPCTLVSNPTSTSLGLSFTTPIPLPTDANGALVPGVYYGVAQNTARQSSSGTGDWWSSSSVGSQSALPLSMQLAASGSRIVTNTTTAFPASFPSAGFPNRRAARDCSTNDDNYECTPTVTAGVAATECFNTLAASSSAPVVTTPNSGTSHYTEPSNTTVNPAQFAASQVNTCSLTYTPTEAYSGSQAPTGGSIANSTATQLATTTVANAVKVSNIAAGALGYATNSGGATAYQGWTATGYPSSTGSSYFQVPVVAGSYEVATINLVAGEGIQSLAIEGLGGTQYFTSATISASLSTSSSSNTNTLTCSSVAATQLGSSPASSATTSTAYFAGSTATTLYLWVTVASSPAPAGTGNIFVHVNYSTDQIVTTCGASAPPLDYPNGTSPETTYTAACPTCSATAPFTSTYSAGNNPNGCWGVSSCPGTNPHQLNSSGPTVNYCVATCPIVNGTAPTAVWSTGLSEWLCNNTTCNGTFNYIANGGGPITTNSGTASQYVTCYSCPTSGDTWNGTATVTNACSIAANTCPTNSGGVTWWGPYSGQCYSCAAQTGGPGGATAEPASSFTLANLATKPCNYTCGTLFPTGTYTAGQCVTGGTYPAFVQATTGSSPATHCLACLANTPTASLNQTGSSPECDYCPTTQVSTYPLPYDLDTGSAGLTATVGSGWKCDYCASGTGTITSCSGNCSACSGCGAMATHQYDCVTAATCANGFTPVAGVCDSTYSSGTKCNTNPNPNGACINPAGYGATGAGCAGSSTTCPPSYTYGVGTCTTTTVTLTADPLTNATGTNCVLSSASTATGGGGTNDLPGNCYCNTSVVTTTDEAYTPTAAVCPGGYTPSNMPSSQCSNAAQGASCNLATWSSSAACKTNYNAAGGGIICTQTSPNPTVSCPVVSGNVQEGEGYFGNDTIYSFQVQPGKGIGSRYYYHFALLRGGPDVTTAGGTYSWVTGGAPNTAGFPATNPPKPFLYIKPGPGAVISQGADPTYPYSIPLAAVAGDTASTSTPAGPIGPVLDCNVSAYASMNLAGAYTFPSIPTSSATADTDYVLAELDGYVPAPPPGSGAATYYLVVDNAWPGVTNSNIDTYVPPAFHYWLQVGGFDDFPTTSTTYTQPSYSQTVAALKQLGAAFVGVENSGLSCFQNTTATINTNAVDFASVNQKNAQFETRDWMEKLAYDVGSYDPTTGRPYVVSLRTDGTACNPACTPSTTCTTQGITVSAGSGCCGSATSTSSSSTWCAKNYPSTPAWDSTQNQCTIACTLDSQCPMTAPKCSAGVCTEPPSCTSGITGLSCAVVSAVQNVTNNLKQNVYLRPIAVTASAVYAAPGGPCTTPTIGPVTSSTSGTCTGTRPYCYGAQGANAGTCTSGATTLATCLAGGTGGVNPVPCASGMCMPSNIPGDSNFYCIDPSVFIAAVQSDSTPVVYQTPTVTCTSNATCTNPNYPVCYITSGTSGSCAGGSQAECGLLTTTTCNPANLNGDCTGVAGFPYCITTGGGSFCGVPDTGVDTLTPQPSYYATTPIITTPTTQLNDGQFNECTPGAQVEFTVTFKMPFQRGGQAQQYEFDLGIYAGVSLVSRKRVILENPALQVSNLYRYYDSTTVCPSGTHVVWGNLTYAALCPQDTANDFSQIRFCATAGTSAASTFVPNPAAANDTAFASEGGQLGGGCAADEVLIGVATANTFPASTVGTPGYPSGGQVNTCPVTGTPGMGYPCAPTAPTNSTPAAAWTACNAAKTSTACGQVDAGGTGCTWTPQAGFNIGTTLQAAGILNSAGIATDQYLRLRMEFDPSQPDDVVAPYLNSWQLTVDCVPSE